MMAAGLEVCTQWDGVFVGRTVLRIPFLEGMAAGLRNHTPGG